MSLADTPHTSYDPLLRVEQQLLAWAEQQLAAGPAALPLLSTPTHAPHWLAPTALVQRLLVHQAAGQLPAPADLAVALARCACHAAQDAAEARQQLPQLTHAGLRELLGWFLAPAGPPQPLPTLAHRQSVGQVLGGLLRRVLPTTAGDTAPAPLPGALPWLWVVAARTRCPAATFEELRPLADYPGVAAPWQPGWFFKQVTHTFEQRWNKAEPTRTQTWTELRVPTERPGQRPPSPLLLYAAHARLRQDDARYLWQLRDNLPFLLSLLPHDPSALHWHAVRTAFRTGHDYAEERDLLTGLLTPLLHPGPACTLAREVLLAATEHGRLVPTALGTALGRLLAQEYAPVPRLADTLTQVRGLGPRPDDALRQLLDVLLPELPAAPPRQTAKLLAAYADLVARTRQPVPAAVQTRLREWSTSAALKKLAAPLLASG